MKNQIRKTGEEMKTVEIYVSGVVQGVGFRYFTRKVARELGIKGYVKNLPDGRVYIRASGDEAMIDKFLSAIRKGPASAIVKRVEVKYVNGEIFQSFEIRY